MKTIRLPFITLLLTVGILSHSFAEDNTKGRITGRGDRTPRKRWH